MRSKPEVLIANAGYFPGDPLLITRETASFPLSTESVEAIIRKYLL